MPAYSSPSNPGTIVLLNGTSCSGKTSIARALQELMPDPWLHVGLDHFEAMQPRKQGQRIHCFYGQGVEQPDFVPVLHDAVAGFARMGANVINEHILLERRWLDDLVARYRDLPVLFVGVLCPLEELERRERERNRGIQIGQSARQFKQLAYLHDANPYDVTFDTSQRTAADCAAQIKVQLENRAAEPRLGMSVASAIVSRSRA